MNKVKIIVYDDSLKLINYLIDNHIYYYDLKCNNNIFTLIVNEKDLLKIKRRYKTNIINYYGKKGIITFLKYNRYMIISFIISLFVLLLLSNTIFDIRVNSSDEEIKSLIIKSLKKEGIEKYKRKKNYKELIKIKNNILKENEDKIEWIEIIEKGTVYNIEVTKRIIKNNNKSSVKESSIYSSKDGLIKRIVVYRGSKIKEINDYVKKGDLLISGNILKDDKVVSKVKSNGIVYAEVWYKAKIVVPFEIIKKEFTGKIINHYYLDINGFKFTILGKYDDKNTISEKKLILKKPYLFFDVYKESKKIYENKKYKISQNEAYDLALKESENKIKEKLKKDEYIISKKVLKKEVKSSKMYVEVFFKVYENIGYTSNIDELGEKNASSN